MRQIIYSSSATRPMDDQELVDLLDHARKNNHSMGVTGILVYHQGDFMQVLEGGAAVVDDLYRVIQEDERHTNIKTILRRNVPDREFSDWEMAFKHVTPEDISRVEGFNELADFKKLNSDIFRENPSLSSAFLQSFLLGLN